MRLVLHLVVVLLFAYSKIAHTKKNKISLISFDEEEVAKITAYNNSRRRFGIRPIFYNADLMRIAQVEAVRLADNGELSAPDWNLTKPYRGYSMRVHYRYGSYCKLKSEKFPLNNFK